MMTRAQVGMLSAEKGADFEVVFAQHMRSSMGFSDVKLNQFLSGKVCQRPHECDILALKKPLAWRLVYAVAVVVMFAGVIVTSAPKVVPKRVTTAVTVAGEKVQKAAGLNSAGAGIIAISIAAFVFGSIGDRNSRKVIWVECKNRKTRVKRDDIAKTLSAVEDVRARVGRKRGKYIDEIWFASTAGFDLDAVNVARERGVVLFLAERAAVGMKFERVY